MRVYIKSRSGAFEGMCKYENGKFVVLKGTRISERIAEFKGANSIKKKRSGTKIDNNILQENVAFNSASTAANFVAGCSKNGLIAWKDKNGVSLKEIMH